MKKIRNLLLLIGMTVCFIATVTAVSTSLAACNHSWFLADSGGSACSGYWERYVCSYCYESKQVTTGVSQGHVWKVSYSEAGDCDNDGFVMYYCANCTELKTDIIPSPGHSYVYTSNNDATCTRDGTKRGTCQRCGKIVFVNDPGSVKGHDFSAGWKLIVTPTCTMMGESVRACGRCAFRETRNEDKTAHKDWNLDRKCDVCSAEMSIVIPIPTPDDDDNNNNNNDNNTQQGDCSCKCHKGGITGFFWKIGNFFNKLFKVKSKQICGCGIYHF